MLIEIVLEPWLCNVLLSFDRFVYLGCWSKLTYMSALALCLILNYITYCRNFILIDMLQQQYSEMSQVRCCGFQLNFSEFSVQLEVRNI